MILGDPDRPFAQRKDTMALDIIHPEDVPRGKVRARVAFTVAASAVSLHRLQRQER